MDVEQRVLEVHGVEVPVEFLVVLVVEIRGLFGPGGLRLVHHKRHVHADLLHLAVLVGCALGVVDVLRLRALHDFHWHELAVGVQDVADAALLEVFLCVVGDVQDDVRAGRVLADVFEGEVGRSVAAPLHRLAAFALAERDDVHLLGNHKGRVESKSKVTNDGLLRVGVLVLLQELGGTGKRDLVDVPVDFLGGHANARVSDGQRAGLLVNHDLNLRRVGDFCDLTELGEHGALLGGVHRV